jgi:type VI protein secretion system component VasK
MKRDETVFGCPLPGEVGSSLALYCRTAILLPAVLFMLVTPAFAYVGPGAGLSMIGSAIALIVVVLVAMAGLIIWPVRAMQRRKKRRRRVRQKNEFFHARAQRRSAPWSYLPNRRKWQSCNFLF